MFSPREFQPSTSAPVVCLGGVTTDPAEWTWLAEYIGGDFRVVAPDLRLDNKATPADWIAAVEDCFHREAMRSGCQINIVAHGSAAIPALCFASAKPELVRSVVLIDASGLRHVDGMIATLREHTDAPVHAIVYSHGHHGYNAAVDVWQRHSEERGDPPPRLVGHENVLHRYARYRETDRLQLRMVSIQFPARFMRVP